MAPISKSQLPGTKPWTNNLTLTSFGLREIDSFLFSSGGEGGGQPLQTFVTLEEDRLTDDLARALCRYWCAEGIAQGQKVALAAFQPSIENLLQSFAIPTHYIRTITTDGSTPEQLHDFIISLPRNLHLDKQRKLAPSKLPANNDSNRESISAIIEEDENEDDEVEDKVDELRSKNEEGLVNAWQYRKTIQDKRSGIDCRCENNAIGGRGVYCHSYDLSKRMFDQFNNYSDDQNPLFTNTNIFDCSHPLVRSTSEFRDANEFQKRGLALFRCIWKHIQSILHSNPNTVVRLFLQRLPIGAGSVAIPLLMAKIRKLNLSVVVLATIRPWKWINSLCTKCNQIDMLASLRNASDVTLALDSFASLRAPPPAEFSLLQGILTIRKCASFNVTHYTDNITLKRPLAERFGVKRDGRKLTTQLLHLPPEEFSKGGSSTSGVRSGGGNLGMKTNVVSGCGSKSLDF